jgi:hypothetical protein
LLYFFFSAKKSYNEEKQDHYRPGIYNNLNCGNKFSVIEEEQKGEANHMTNQIQGTINRGRTENNSEAGKYCRQHHCQGNSVSSEFKKIESEQSVLPLAFQTPITFESKYLFTRRHSKNQTSIKRV